MLAATLAVGSVPAISLVQASTGAEGASVALAAEAGYDLGGKSYAVGVTWAGSADLGDMASIAQSMLANYFGNQVQVSQNEDGSFNVVISFVKYSDAIQQIEYNGQSIQQSSNQTYTLVVSSLDEPIAAKLYIGGAMANMFPDGVGFTMAVDTSELPEAEPEPPATTVDKTALNNAISEAKAIVQGNKTDEAWTELQEAIATAEKAAANEKIPQQGIDAVVAQLNAAIEAFNASEDVTVPTPEAQTIAVSYFVKDSGNAFSGMLPGEVQAVEAADGGYDVSIPVAASTINMVKGTFWMKDASGADAAVVEGEDGSRTYTIHVSSVSGAAELSFGYTVSMGGHEMSNTHNMILRFFDCSAINAALASVKQIEDDGSDAYAELDSVVTEVKAVVSNPSATEADLEAAAAQLNAAIEAFNGSGQEDSDAVETPGGFLLVPQQAYEVPVSVIKDDGSASMAAQYFEKTGTVVWNGESYLVDFSVTAEGQEYIQSIEGIESLGEGIYRTTIDSLTDPVTLTFTLQTPMGAMTQTAYLQIDTSSLPTTSGEPIDPADPQPSDPGTTGGNGSTSTSDQNNQQEVAAKFQKGRTYQVPIDFLKHNSSEVSMADQYFGDTALVRVSDDGTMLNVSFAATADGMTHIISLAYQGATLSPSGTQFTVSIPYAESNVVLPISMTIKEMQELGGSAQTADLHLYLTQAKDLGANAGSLSASSSRTMADTGDGVSPIVAIAGGVAVAAAAAATSVAGSQMRRRLTRKE